MRLARVAGAVILMYHSVPGPETAEWIDPANATAVTVFEKQMQFLRQYRHVVSMDDLVEMVVQGRDPAPGTVAITFDDGYLDNVDVVAPILNRHQLPAILYLATQYVGLGRTQWIDEIHSMFRCRTRHSLQLTAESGWDLRDPKALAMAYSRVRQLLSVALWDQREQMLQELDRQLQPSARALRLTATWDEIRKLRSLCPLFKIGAHTASHTDLRAHGGALAQEQLTRGIRDAERELGERPEHFSFPYGRSSQETRSMVCAAGFKSAVAAGDGYLITSRSDRYALARVAPPASMTLFRYYTSGAFPGMCRSLLGSS